LLKSIRFRMLHRPCLLIACLFGTGCSGAANVPDTPDFAGLRAQYDQPSGTVDETTVLEVLEMADMTDLENLAAGLSSLQLASDGVGEASEAAGAKTGSGIDLQGSITVNVRCPGELDEPVYDAAQNGSLSLTIAVESTRILRSIAGTASNCRAHPSFFGRTVRAAINGPFAFDLGGDIALGQRGSDTLLFSLGGEIIIEDTPFAGITGRLRPNSFESLFTLPDGNTVVLVVLAEGVIGVRDHDGTWSCNTADLRCARN
jgi:hypothetical protein